MNIIEVRDLCKTYDEGALEVRALNNVSLSFAEGEFTAIVGPSGSGKTTFLNLIGGLDRASSGEISIQDNSLTQLSNSELTKFRLMNIGFVFQSYNLIPVLTAVENVEFTMYLQGLPHDKRRQRAMELLSAVGLSDRAKSRPNKLSGGQQQRVAVARALAPKPHFILADEPTANLDSASAETLLDIMESLNRTENITFIFSTHDARVMKKARRIITLEDGKVLKDEKVI